MKADGTNFVVDGESYFWKIISADKFGHIISDDGTDWMLIHSENGDLILLGKVYYSYSNILGQKDNPRLLSFWLLKCSYDGIQIQNDPIHIITPHYFSSPKHRIEADMIKLISKLKDKNVEIIQDVDYRTHKTDRLRIR